MFQNNMLLIVISVNSIMLNTLCIKKLLKTKRETLLIQTLTLLVTKVMAHVSITSSGCQHQFYHQV